MLLLVGVTTTPLGNGSANPSLPATVAAPYDENDDENEKEEGEAKRYDNDGGASPSSALPVASICMRQRRESIKAHSGGGEATGNTCSIKNTRFVSSSPSSSSWSICSGHRTVNKS